MQGREDYEENARYLRVVFVNSHASSRLLRSSAMKTKEAEKSLWICTYAHMSMKSDFVANQSSVREIKRKSIRKLSRDFCGSRIKFPLFYFHFFFSLFFFSSFLFILTFLLLAPLTQWILFNDQVRLIDFVRARLSRWKLNQYTSKSILRNFQVYRLANENMSEEV